MIGPAYVGSLLFLTAVVVSVYSLAQDPDLPVGQIMRRALRRAGKLLGVLAGLAIVVFFLSKI